MRIEVLFPEVGNLYGELGNVRCLRESLPDAEIIETSLNDEPLFIHEDVDLVYMGTMTEKSQGIVVNKLMLYKNEIEKKIESGMNFLITGNALEVFGKNIYENDVLVLECLGIFDFESRRDKRKRYNCIYVGEFDNGAEKVDIVGFKSLFGFAYGEAFKNNRFVNTKVGYGINREVKEEGLHVNNFIATYITGPILILNPLFTKWLIQEKLGDKNALPAFYEDAMNAYEYRLKEYTKPGKGWEY